MIASDYPDVELAGHECQVDSANVVDGVIETLVWIPDIELMAVVEGLPYCDRPSRETSIA